LSLKGHQNEVAERQLSENGLLMKT